MRNSNKNINRHPTLPDNIIYSSIKSINKTFNTEIDIEQFFDPCMSSFCLASYINQSTISLSFPVVATSEYASIELSIKNNLPDTNSIQYNKAFKLEIDRVAR